MYETILLKVVTDANQITGSGDYWIFQSGAKNVPDNITAWIVNQYQLNKDTILQEAKAFSPNATQPKRSRRRANGVWSDWKVD
ncbi:pyocin knob domain-containing protein [Alkalicoccobacillus porphyridii]|uniref:Uncharacterized protein n=1 Tax=Alkalicoccobacillus porphyridii TaxID=2597270 RepID=A0A554A328_9BACI|nr:pyocin knob domain-containing protein [Alkalicoccobacillus porphyridii]TSB48075.1 hypothetical protein FN960_00525 [Alkalicoccobacillus porphyridii]